MQIIDGVIEKQNVKIVNHVLKIMNVSDHGKNILNSMDGMNLYLLNNDMSDIKYYVL
jgi:hypothetical protein